MNQSTIARLLERLNLVSPLDHYGETTQSFCKSDRKASTLTGKISKMLIIVVGDPWSDYEYIDRLGQDMIATRKSSYYGLVRIRQSRTSDAMEQTRILSTIQHPNIAAVYAIYCDGNNIFTVAEHLPVSFPQLEVQKYYTEEWEMATIIVEVLKGIVHLSSLKLSCREISVANIRLSLNGEIKLILDFHELRYENLQDTSKLSHAILDFPILAEIIEEMMLPRYHLISSDAKLSEEALSFLSCTLSESLETLMKHSFLHIAASPKRLIPRIRFTFERSRIGSSGIEESLSSI